MSASKSTRSHGKSNTSIVESSEPSAESNNEFSVITSSKLEVILAAQFEKNRSETEKTIKDAIKHELSSMKNEIIRLQSELETVSGVANNAMKLAEQVKKDLTKLQEENSHLKTQLKNDTNEHNKMLEVVEDNKNRQLRKTLVFKGIPEQDQSENVHGSGSSRGENWDNTATVLAKSMSEALGTSIEEASKMVERCHRAAPNPNYRGNMPRPIFAAFLDWRDSERTKVAFRKIKTGVIAEQKGDYSNKAPSSMRMYSTRPD